MFNASPSIQGITLFDCEYIEECWKCNQVCFSGLRIKLRYKFSLEGRTCFCLCASHSLKALKWNFIDLPSNKTDFLFTQRYSSVRQDLLNRIRGMVVFTPQSLRDDFDQGKIQYWRETNASDSAGNSREGKQVKIIESPDSKVQAVIRQDADQIFCIQYAYPSHIEFGEREWVLEKSDKITFSSDFKSAISIAILELMQRLGKPIVRLE